MSELVKLARELVGNTETVAGQWLEDIAGENAEQFIDCVPEGDSPLLVRMKVYLTIEGGSTVAITLNLCALEKQFGLDSDVIQLLCAHVARETFKNVWGITIFTQYHYSLAQDFVGYQYELSLEDTCRIYGAQTFILEDDVCKVIEDFFLFEFINVDIPTSILSASQIDCDTEASESDLINCNNLFRKDFFSCFAEKDVPDLKLFYEVVQSQIATTMVNNEHKLNFL